VDTPQARLETIQALLLLMAMGTWARRALLRDALCLQSHIALLIREQGLSDTGPLPEDIGWEDWIRAEGEKRTKFIVYCFLNLHCIAYNMPPLLLTSEIKLNLPCTAKEWKAENSRQWREIRRTTGCIDVSFHDALTKLFLKLPAPKNDIPLSSFGNYILIHALVQHIFFVRQTSAMSFPATANNSLRSEDIDELGQALKKWQVGWERSPESSLDPSNPNGPLAFNSTALLRLAYIRLHSDLGPCRRLDTRDPVRIAAAFKDSPPLERSARLGRAVLQSAHALSIPVRIGIAFVARTQTFSWSIQHSLCNLECAFLLSKSSPIYLGSN
jgi:Fungal specific transcription factor domain